MPTQSTREIATCVNKSVDARCANGHPVSSYDTHVDRRTKAPGSPPVERQRTRVSTREGRSSRQSRPTLVSAAFSPQLTSVSDTDTARNPSCARPHLALESRRRRGLQTRRQEVRLLPSVPHRITSPGTSSLTTAEASSPGPSPSTVVPGIRIGRVRSRHRSQLHGSLATARDTRAVASARSMRVTPDW